MTSFQLKDTSPLPVVAVKPVGVGGFSLSLRLKGNLSKYSNNHKAESLPEIESDISLYYGKEGKREAIIRFLSLVLERKKASYLYLYSDESMAWLTEDSTFQIQWMELLIKVITQGNRIIIIHTVSRNFDDMLEALSKWIPIYMTGAIEPYFYPKKRDGIFKRTMFIAPGEAAISANSINPMSDNVTNILFREKKAVDALVEEFNHYLSLCKPLMRIFTDTNRQDYLQTVNEFENEIENTILKTDGLSLLTMPDKLVMSILERVNAQNKKELFDYFQFRKETFLETIKTKQFNELIKLDEIVQIKEGEAPIGYTGITELFGVKYTPEEYRDHLNNIIVLLSTYDNYNVVIDGKADDDKYRVYVKEDLGAIVEKTTKPYVVFALNELNMTAAFWDYLNIYFDGKKMDKQKVIQELKDIVKEL